MDGRAHGRAHRRARRRHRASRRRARLPALHRAGRSCARAARAARGEGRAPQVLELLEAGARAAPRVPAFRHLRRMRAAASRRRQPMARRRTALARAALRQHGFDGGADRAAAPRPAGTRRRAQFRDRTAARQGGADRDRLPRAREPCASSTCAACAVLHPALLALVAPLRRSRRSCGRRAGGRGDGDAGRQRHRSAARSRGAAGNSPRSKRWPNSPRRRIWRAWPGARRARNRRRSRSAGRCGSPSAVSRSICRRRAFLQASAEAEAMLRPPCWRASARRGRWPISSPASAPSPSRSRRHAARSMRSRRAAGDRRARARRPRAPALPAGSACERRDLEARPLGPEELARFDAVVFDPPRAGAAAQGRALAGSPRAARRRRLLQPRELRPRRPHPRRRRLSLVEVQPIDSFIWSPHLRTRRPLRPRLKNDRFDLNQ